MSGPNKQQRQHNPGIIIESPQTCRTDWAVPVLPRLFVPSSAVVRELIFISSLSMRLIPSRGVHQRVKKRMCTSLLPDACALPAAVERSIGLLRSALPGCCGALHRLLWTRFVWLAENIRMNIGE
ncbi:unnamed protein product [Pleuronectes platessa]|uniref:Uncharacterized protein n=1 Tax=Pleuronectes platessa TaxID=8262 RepID=A0A9N7THL0_PLEPL|nr:unnamed protein product [Pleuronectes platessa]